MQQAQQVAEGTTSLDSTRAIFSEGQVGVKTVWSDCVEWPCGVTVHVGLCMARSIPSSRLLDRTSFDNRFR